MKKRKPGRPPLPDHLKRKGREVKLTPKAWRNLRKKVAPPFGSINDVIQDFAEKLG